jgi:purine-nucleoside/S-methyl-5'-thioadenosine phosphorylase / adenosine deaminase
MKSEPKTGTPFEVFPELEAFGWLKHVFTLRQPEIEIGEDRARTLQLLRQNHDRILSARGIPLREMASAQQVHGNRVAWLDRKPQLPIADTDGLATNVPGLPIGVYVADCCAVFLIDERKKAIALLHSGVRGTEQNIAREGVRTLVRENGSEPASLTALLGPCIRGCCYRTEFADQIAGQLAAEGVENIVRRDRCTACNNKLYYSYNKEKGHTGRMLAALMIT